MVRSSNVTGVVIKALNVQSFSARALDATATAQPYRNLGRIVPRKGTTGAKAFSRFARCILAVYRSIHIFAMPSTEAKLLSDFLVAPASLRDFMTLRQFTDIFPKSHRTNPAVKELYHELYVLRDRDIEAVRQDIVHEVKRSKQLKRDYALERRQVDEANVAGLDPVARQMEEEVCPGLYGCKHLLTLRSS